MTDSTDVRRTYSLDNRIPPPVVAAITAALMWGLAHVGPTIGRQFAGQRLLAIAFTIVALSLIGSAFLTFRRANTTIDPVHIDRASSLVTGGVFRLTRNPMYCALTALLTAWAIGLGAATAFAGPVLFALYMTRFQIIPEEHMMQRKFGVAYEAYSMRTRRWL